MKIFQIVDNYCYWLTPYRTLAETVGRYSPEIKFVEAPDYVFEGWGYFEKDPQGNPLTGDDRFIKPETPKGFEYDDATGTFYEIGYQEIAQIRNIKNQLSETDYKAIKYAEGLISEEDYKLIKEQRQAWRNEINNLENIIENKRQEANVEYEIHTSEQQEL